MKTRTIEVNTYEVGDIIDIQELKARHMKPALTTAKKALVICCRCLNGGLYSYNVLTNEMKKTSITPEELGGEKYIGNISLSELTDE